MFSEQRSQNCSDSAQAEEQKRGAVEDLAAPAFAPRAISCQLSFSYGAIAKSGGGSFIERARGERQMRSANAEPGSIGERGLCGFHIRKEILVGEQVPYPLSFPLLDGKDAQQTETALKLKDEIVARRKGHSSHNHSPEFRWNQESSAASLT